MAKKYAHLTADKIVIEVVKPVDGFSIEQCFTAGFLANLVGIPDGVDTPAHGMLFDGETFITPPPKPLPQITWADFQSQAQAALVSTDNVALRCFKSGIQFPQSWIDYTSALREIVRAANGDPTVGLPKQPDYPAGS